MSTADVEFTRIQAPTSLRRNFASTFTGNVIYSGCQWLAMVVIARFGTPEMLGQFALGVAVSTPILTCSSLQLRAVQVTDSVDTYQFSDFIVLRALGTLIATLSIIGIATFSSWPVQTRAVVLILGLRAAAESFSDITYGYFQKREQFNLIAQAMILRGIAGILALSIGLWLTKSILLATMLMTGAWVVCLVCYEFPALADALRRNTRSFESRLEPTVLFPRIRSLIVVSLPLAMVMFFLSSSQSVPRLFLERYEGTRTLGVFSAVATLSGGIGLIYAAVGQTALPTLSKLYVRSSSQFVTLLTNMILIAVGPGLALIVGVRVFAPQILTLAYGAAFAGYGSLMTGLTIVVVMNNLSTLLGVGATASRHFRPQLIASLITCAAALVTGAVLIPRGGLSGAMYSAIITAAVQLAIYTYLCISIVSRG